MTLPATISSILIVLACAPFHHALSLPYNPDQTAGSSDGAIWPFGSGEGTLPWHSSGSHSSGSYWFEEWVSVLDTMQSTYWNGTYWPTTIQWIGAFLDTLLAASDRSFTNVLVEYDGTIPGTSTSHEGIQSGISGYYNQIVGYYGNEDTIQIFGAAYDDAQWVVLEWLEAIKFINKYDMYASTALGQDDIAGFAHRAHIFYNIVAGQFNTTLCGGGLTWNPALAVYKNSITNELFISSSIGMYLYFPGDSNTDPYPNPDYTETTNLTLPDLAPLSAHDPSLLDNAIKEYSWFKSQPFRNAQGLVIDGFHISDGQTTCDQPSDMVYTYNQGVLLSGLRQLWEATGDQSYLEDAYAYIYSTINATGWYARTGDEAAQWHGLGRNGIMEDYCDAAANCSQDAQMFKGIYFHHLDLFCEPLPTRKPLINGITHVASSSLAGSHARKCQGYVPWVAHNARAALATRNSTSNIIGEWWGASYINQTQAPNPGYSQPNPGPDPWNHPRLLKQPPWVCEGKHECGKDRHHHNTGLRTRRVAHKLVEGISNRQASSDSDDTRTVQTQGSGLSVVKAAADLMLKRPPG
ncbi:glycoside hydrolase family 76 protein [Polychaeton citri CBS 116435]|uniref:Glycoside hydrolase family 76 protein n=1 Tax=Polychaeton citri CBS 116435 TaxID=1314669 RepID=A0A9P4Q745_9PEZI|nr:glycoside hydrolase family 76 protein [Polychaeton citri CBS 116435]